MLDRRGDASCVFRASIETSHQTTVWWDWNRTDADATIVQFSQDAEQISKRQAANAIVEQRIYFFTDRTSQRGPKAVSEILNNTWPCATSMRIAFDNGEITEYMRASKHESWKLQRVPLESPPAPTQQYALAYKEILRNPALYSLCARSSSFKTWETAVRRIGWKQPRRIMSWLYGIIKHEPR